MFCITSSDTSSTKKRRSSNDVGTAHSPFVVMRIIERHWSAEPLPDVLSQMKPVPKPPGTACCMALVDNIFTPGVFTSNARCVYVREYSATKGITKMFGNTEGMPKAMVSSKSAESVSLASMIDIGVDEEEVSVLMGYNLGNVTWAGDVPLAKFIELSEIANDAEKGEVAQRKLDVTHAKALGLFMLKGLVNSAITRRMIRGQNVPDAYYHVQKVLGPKPYCALQPVVANIRAIDPSKPSVRADRAVTERGVSVGFRVFLPRSYRWWVIDGQHRRFGGEMVIDWLKDVTRSGKYPARGGLFDIKGDVTPDEMAVWLDALDCARSFATVKIEFHLGLDIDQERQLFHDLNNLGKKVNVSQATEYDLGNPINNFIKERLLGEQTVHSSDRELKDWAHDDGSVNTKDLAAICAIAFLNKTNVKSASPSVVDEREAHVEDLWRAIASIPGFGQPQARHKTVAAQPVVLKALAKITFDLLFSNRRPDNGDALFGDFLQRITAIDFSHENMMWRYYNLSDEERASPELDGLASYLPDAGETSTEANRDIGAYQGGMMRFGAKHNDIYPILADMIRWKLKLPSRRVADPEETGQA
ncbi:MAG: hypothetical protein E5Y19_16990 [Mesorhizobium sp.]|nr:MAG: hypothetical protein E5Y19_16990 [Mesorhizobium sp.]TJU75693.1 MAG: hypothetical protein E5Y15_29550 [Mesorhizobium sp.]